LQQAHPGGLDLLLNLLELVFVHSTVPALCAIFEGGQRVHLLVLICVCISFIAFADLQIIEPLILDVGLAQVDSLIQQV